MMSLGNPTLFHQNFHWSIIIFVFLPPQNGLTLTLSTNNTLSFSIWLQLLATQSFILLITQSATQPFKRDNYLSIETL